MAGGLAGLLGGMIGAFRAGVRGLRIRPLPAFSAPAFAVPAFAVPAFAVPALAAVAGLAAAGSAMAAGPMTGKAAAKMLFSPTSSEVVIVETSGLSASDQVVLAQLFKLSERDLQLLDQLPGISAADRESAKTVFRQFKEARYYASVAAAPVAGLVTPATRIAQNLHSPEAADAAAIAACEGAATEACVVVARVLPKRFTRQELMLSADATAAMKTYRKMRGPRALAASRATAEWVLSEGFGAAVTALRECNERAAPHGAADCAVVAADE